MLTNAQLQELAHFKAKLRHKMALNADLSALTTNKIYCHDILAQTKKNAHEKNDH